MSSRELNPFEPDDRALLAGISPNQPLDSPDEDLVGVFVQATNVGSHRSPVVAAPELVSADGDVFQPLKLPATDPFAYRGGPLARGGQVPDPDSAPAESSEDGAVLAYRVPDNTFVTDRPFTVRFGPSDRAASVELDL